MFQVGSEDFEEAPLFCAAMAEGLFTDARDTDISEEGLGTATVSFTGITRVNEVVASWQKPTSLDFVDVDIVSTNGRLLGHYDLGAALLSLDSATDLVVLAEVQPVSLVDGLAVWQRWCDESKPLARGEWLSLSSESRETWLAVARSVWGVNGYGELPDGGAGPSRMDGTLITDETSFFLTLGEALVGPGGYVGSGLDAMDDCFSFLPRSLRQAGLSWNGFSGSEERLDGEFLAEVLDIFKQRGVTLTVDSGT